MTEARKAAAPKPRKASPSAAARRAEANDWFVIIEQCGLKLRIPMGDNYPMSAVLRFQGLNDDLTPLPEGANRNLLGLQAILGPEQWSEFMKKRPSTGDFNELDRKFSDLSGN